MIGTVKCVLQGNSIALLGIFLAACGGGANRMASPAGASMISLAAPAYSLMQSAGTVAVTINRSGGSNGAVSASYATSDGTAIGGADYTGTMGTVDWADGDAASKIVSIPVSTSPAWSGTKTLTLTLANPIGAAMSSTTTATITITGGGTPAPGTLSLSGASYAVAQNTGSLVITVNRIAGSTGAIGISYTTTDGTAAAGPDYTAATGTLQWADGDAAAKTFSVAISHAFTFSGSKTFMVALSMPTGGATIGTPSSATATINGSSSASSPGVIALSASAYSVAQGSGTLVATVNRTGGSTGAVSVGYATSDGTAIAGTNYTAASGILRWSAGSTSAKVFSITIAATPALTASKTFTITLSAVTGGAALAASSAAATITVAGATATSVRVSGNHLIDATGNILQLRGVDVSGLEFSAIDGSNDPWGGQKPNLSAIAAWKANTLRIPLNEASYLGYTCYDPPNAAVHNPDPSGTYTQAVKQLVTDATAMGFYVILDLHKNAPKGQINNVLYEIAPQSTTQNQMADSDNSVAFWTAIAADFRGSPNVIFDLFNEPYFDNVIAPAGVSYPNISWTILRDGGTNTLFYGANSVFQQHWQSAGMQALLDAVRATGATNVILSAGVSWAQDNSQWTAYRPVDPLKQLALSWHAYPMPGTTRGTPAYTNPGYPLGYMWAAAILAADYPIVIGETGEQSSNGTTGSPFLDVLLPWADLNHVSVIGWSWNAWGSPNADLIKDASGTPTDGYGAAFKTWMVNHH